MAIAAEHEILAINTVQDARAWAAIQREAWDAVDVQLGGVPFLRLLAYIQPSALRQSVARARVPTPGHGAPADADYVAPSDRPMAPVEVTQVGLMWRLARQKYGLPDLDPLVAQAAPVAPAGAPPAAPADEKKHKVKVNQVLDQVDEGEIPRLQEAELDAFYERLREVKGGPVRPEAEPSPDQISAMKVRVLDLEMAPYADFGLFVNHQQRFARTLKFMSHQLQPDGTWRSVEIHGPPNFWRVYENVLLVLTKPVGGGLQPIITQAALDDYRDSFRDLAVNYPESWHLLVSAEDRCRGGALRPVTQAAPRGVRHRVGPRVQSR